MRNWNPLLGTAALGLLLGFTAQTSAQENSGDRFEVGQRLQAFEKTLDTHGEPESLRRALPHLKKATTAFLLFGQGGEAGRSLDRARHALLSDKEPEDAIAWAESLALRLSRRLLDASAESLPLTLATHYPVQSPLPPGARLRVTLLSAGGRAGCEPMEWPIPVLPMTVKYPLQGIKEGDSFLRWDILAGQRLLQRRELTVSFAARLEERLRDVGAWAQKGVEAERRNADRETACLLAALLKSLAQGESPETNYPASRLLAEAEEAIESVRSRKAFYGPAHTGQFWLRLPTANDPRPVRILVPEAALKGQPIPLVVALHGARGSENLFFDGYGHGLSARLCEQRGWLLVAPRDGLTPDLVDEIARLYPVDRKRVFLMGHSLGASRAVAEACQNPDRYAAVAALSGGGPARASQPLKALPFFLAVGSEDFLIPAVRTLRTNLEQAGVRSVQFKEVPDVEHLALVQLALPGVFAYFDRAPPR